VKSLNKTVRVSFAVILILAIASIGFANATPRLLKECNMVYWTSDNPTLKGVPGNQVSGFKLTLNGNTDPNFWYYLNIKFLKPSSGEPLPAGVYMFYLTPPSTADEAFWFYWQAKGVTLANFMAHISDPVPTWPWQSFMWLIIHGFGAHTLPMFGLYSDGAGNYELRDGLVHFASGSTVVSPLRLNGDYPKGTYTFTCLDATETQIPYNHLAENVLDAVSMTITFR
jgi:hypothetical protein